MPVETAVCEGLRPRFPSTVTPGKNANGRLRFPLHARPSQQPPRTDVRVQLCFTAVTADREGRVL